MMLLGGTFSVMASKFIGYPSAGALGCIMIAFVAGIGWRRQRTTPTALSEAATANTSDTLPPGHSLQLQPPAADELVSLYTALCGCTSYFFYYSISSLSRVQKHSVGGAPPHRENRSRIFNILIFELEIVFAWRAEFHPLAKFEFCLFSFTNNWRRAKCFCKAKKICDSRWTSSCISFICFRRSTPLVYTFSVFGRLYI